MTRHVPGLGIVAAVDLAGDGQREELRDVDRLVGVVGVAVVGDRDAARLEADVRRSSRSRASVAVSITETVFERAFAT